MTMVIYVAIGSSAANAHPYNSRSWALQNNAAWSAKLIENYQREVERNEQNRDRELQRQINERERLTNQYQAPYQPLPASSEEFFWGRDHRGTENIARKASNIVLWPTVEAEAKVATLQGNIQTWQKPEGHVSAPVDKIMYSIEDRLINLHDHQTIGSFDIDSFTQRLLQIKRNYAAMTEKRSGLSPRQEIVLRTELAGLQKDISGRLY